MAFNIHVRSPLLTESRLIYFPLGTEMFHFPKLYFLKNFFLWELCYYDDMGSSLQPAPDFRFKNAHQPQIH
jgi:hypothetical protein